MFYLFLRHDAFSFDLSSDELSAGLFFCVLLRAPKYSFMANAARPPVDALPATNSAAVARQNGHICVSFCYCDIFLLSCSSSGTLGFGLLADAFEYVCPPLAHPGFVFIGNKPQRGVAEGDQSAVFFLAQAILQIVYDRSRHEERPG
jgi:hypothetical protein